MFLRSGRTPSVALGLPSEAGRGNSRQPQGCISSLMDKLADNIKSFEPVQMGREMCVRAGTCGYVRVSCIEGQQP